MTRKRLYVTLLTGVAMVIAIHITFVQPQSLRTLRTILNRVYDPSIGKLRTTTWAGPAIATQLTEVEIFNKVFDAGNNMLLVSGGGEGGHTLKDEGNTLPTETNLNFIGAGVSCVDNPGAASTDCTITGAAAGDAVADGATKGIATFAAADFNSAAGIISLDYTNGQKATTSLPGFLSAADWTTFNNKQAALGFTAAPNTASFLTTTAESGLSGEANLGALTTGLLKITVSGGIATPSTAVNGTDYQAALGFTAENIANKDTTTSLGTSNTLYPTQNAVKVYVDSGTKTLSNTRIKERACSQSDVSSITLALDGCDFVTIAELSQGTTFNPPTGTNFDGDFFTLVIYTTTARALTFSTATNGFSAENGIALPITSRTAGYVAFGFRWNAASAKWAITAATQATTLTSRGIQFEIGDPAGSALAVASTTTSYVTVPFACILSAYDLMIDAGTITVKFWKVATGTSIPTSGNSINTSGVSVSSGTAVHSTVMSDFNTTTVTAYDRLAMNVTAVSTAKYVSATLECDN